MSLTIRGSVKHGEHPVATRVQLEIQNKDGANRRTSASDTGADGKFESKISDVTGITFDYAGGKVRGEVMRDMGDERFVPDKRFVPIEKSIEDTVVVLDFYIIDYWKELQQRIKGALLLSRDTLTRIADAEDALQQAMIVAGLACVAFGAIVGSGAGFVGAVLVGLLVLVSWGISVALTYAIGTTVLAVEETTRGFANYLRPVGFAATPLLAAAIIMTLLWALGASPKLLNALFLVALLWEIVAITAAVNVALSYGKEWWRAFVAVLLPPAVAFVIFLWMGPR